MKVEAKIAIQKVFYRNEPLLAQRRKGPYSFSSFSSPDKGNDRFGLIFDRFDEARPVVREKMIDYSHLCHFYHCPSSRRKL
jgi:hypothetical protein